VDGGAAAVRFVDVENPVDIMALFCLLRSDTSKVYAASHILMRRFPADCRERAWAFMSPYHHRQLEVEKL
jgi:hypothetical protein